MSKLTIYSNAADLCKVEQMKENILSGSFFHQTIFFFFFFNQGRQ